MTLIKKYRHTAKCFVARVQILTNSFAREMLFLNQKERTENIISHNLDHSSFTLGVD